MDNYQSIPKYVLTKKDWDIIDRDYLPKYEDWDWNYGFSPSFEYQRDQHFKVGTIEFNLKIDQGRIQAARIYGDFFAKKDIAEIESALLEQRLERESLLEVFNQFDLSEYFGAITSEELVQLILS